MNAPFTKDPASSRPVRRILALWFPHLATDRILRGRLGRSWRTGARQHEKSPHEGAPLVISHRVKNTQRVAALDEMAEALNLKPDMGLAEARAMHPAIEVIEADPDADRRLLESLADWCDRYTPLVGLDRPDGLFLDISGCTHLFGGEKAMLHDVLARFFGQGFDARAGIASTPGAAWAAARFLSPALIMPDAEAEALSALPLSALRLEPGIRLGLESVGLRTAGAIMAVPRAPLARRFGAGLLMRLDQALGHLEEAVSPRLPVAVLSVERALAEPITRIEDIEYLVGQLAQTLKADLERRNEGARLFQLALFRVDGAVARITVGTARPLRDPERIERLFREKLAATSLEADFGFDLVRLSVLTAAVFDAAQVDLAGDAGIDEEKLAHFVDRVRARLGERTMLALTPIESHIPERAVVMVPFPATQPAGTALKTPQGHRPLRLFHHPEPVAAVAEVPEGPPITFRWRRALHRVARAEGPERIAPEWWLAAQPGHMRDYFRVEDEAGRRYWLYREGLYDAGEETPRWFMQGIFA